MCVFLVYKNREGDHETSSTGALTPRHLIHIDCPFLFQEQASVGD